VLAGPSFRGVDVTEGEQVFRGAVERARPAHDARVVRECIERSRQARDGRGAWRAERECVAKLGGGAVAQACAAAAVRSGRWLAAPAQR
jgi:hypothetical protein